MRSNVAVSLAAVASWLVTAVLTGSLPSAAGQEEASPPGSLRARPGDEAAPGSDALELCGEATAYDARQAGGVVTVAARGSHRTAGFKVVLEQSPLRIFPPQFVLKHDPPDGPAAQVITPFRLRATFPAGEDVRAVIVHDARGQHSVKVERGYPGDGAGEVLLIARADRRGGGGGDVAKPAVIDDAEDLARALPTLIKAFPDAGDLPGRLTKVDFTEQTLLYFNWSGSGRDELDVRVEEGAKGPAVVFLYRPGSTRDLGTHDRLFAIPEEASWRVQVVTQRGEDAKGAGGEK